MESFGESRDDPVAVSALWWRHFVECGLAAATQFGQRLLLVHYESLVDAPDIELSRICDFLELKFSPAMTDCFVKAGPRDEGKSAKSQWLPPTQGLRDWQHEMDPEDVELFGLLAGNVLGQLNYTSDTDSVTQKVQWRATRAQAWWQRVVESRGARKSDREASA